MLPGISKKYLRPQKKTLVIGDSHAPHLCGTKLKKMSSKRNYTACWLGPKLLYSVSRDGFNIPYEDTIALIDQKFSRLIIILGEIDIRVHLADQTSRIANLRDDCAAYCFKIGDLAMSLGIKDITVICGPPPSDYGADNPSFPRNGSLGSRVKVFYKLNSILEDVIKNEFSDIKYAFPWDGIQSSDGSLRKGFSHDGCHLNSRGARKVRLALEQ